MNATSDAEASTAEASTADVNPKAQEELEPGYRNAPLRREAHAEGSLTRAVEQATAKIPSSAFLSASIVAMLLSMGYEAAGKHRASRFIGMWAPTLLIMGVYNKLVKVNGPV